MNSILPDIPSAAPHFIIKTGQMPLVAFYDRKFLAGDATCARLISMLCAWYSSEGRAGFLCRFDALLHGTDIASSFDAYAYLIDAAVLLK